MAARGLTALPNDELIAFLNSEIRNKFNKVALVGTDALNDTVLKKLLETTAKLSYNDVKAHVFAEFDAEVTYFDDSGIFTAVASMTNENSYNKHLYAVVLMSEDKTVATVAKTPIIFLNEQIGGNFPIKIPINGEVCEVVFRSSKYLTEIEAEERFLAPTISAMTLSMEALTYSLENEIKQIGDNK